MPPFAPLGQSSAAASAHNSTSFKATAHASPAMLGPPLRKLIKRGKRLQSSVWHVGTNVAKRGAKTCLLLESRDHPDLSPNFKAGTVGSAADIEPFCYQAKPEKFGWGRPHCRGAATAPACRQGHRRCRGLGYHSQSSYRVAQRLHPLASVLQQAFCRPLDCGRVAIPPSAVRCSLAGQGPLTG